MEQFMNQFASTQTKFFAYFTDKISKLINNSTASEIPPKKRARVEDDRQSEASHPSGNEEEEDIVPEQGQMNKVSKSSSEVLMVRNHRKITLMLRILTSQGHC